MKIMDVLILSNKYFARSKISTKSGAYKLDELERLDVYDNDIMESNILYLLQQEDTIICKGDWGTSLL